MPLESELFKLSVVFDLPLKDLEKLDGYVVEKLFTKISSLDGGRGADEAQRRMYQERSVQLEELVKDNENLRQGVLQLEKELQVLKSSKLVAETKDNVNVNRIEVLEKNNRLMESELEEQYERSGHLERASKEELAHLTNEIATLSAKYEAEVTKVRVSEQKHEKLLETVNEKSLKIKQLQDTIDIGTSDNEKKGLEKDELMSQLQQSLENLKDENGLLKDQVTEMPRIEEKLLQWESLNVELQNSKDKIRMLESNNLRLESVIETFKTSNDLTDFTLKSNGDFIILKKQLLKERSLKESLEEQLQAFIQELETNLPDLHNYKTRVESLQKKLNDSLLLVEHEKQAASAKNNELKALKIKLNETFTKGEIITKQRNDLAHQLQYLLLHSAVASDSKGILTKREVNFIKNVIDESNMTSETDSDSQKVISDRMVVFKNIVSLQKNNMQLLKTVRDLAKKLEIKESFDKKEVEAYKDDLINEAKASIENLQSYTTELENKIEMLKQQKSQSKSLKFIDSYSATGSGNTSHVSNSETIISDLQKKLTLVSENAASTISCLNNQIKEYQDRISKDRIDLSKDKAAAALSIEKLQLLQLSMDALKIENEKLKNDIESLKDIIKSKENVITSTTNDFVEMNTENFTLKLKSKKMNNEIEILKSTQKTLSADLQSAYMANSELKSDLIKEQYSNSQLTWEKNLDSDSSKKLISNLETEKNQLSSKLNSIKSNLEETIASKDKQLEWYRKKFDLLTSQNSSSGTKLYHFDHSTNHSSSPVDESETDTALDNLKCSETSGKETPRELEIIIKEVKYSRSRIHDLLEQNEKLVQSANNDQSFNDEKINTELQQEKVAMTDKIIEYENDVLFLFMTLTEMQSKMKVLNDKYENLFSQHSTVLSERKSSTEINTKLEHLKDTELENEKLKLQNDKVLQDNMDLKEKLVKTEKELNVVETHLSQLKSDLESLNVESRKQHSDDENWKKQYEELLQKTEATNGDALKALKDEVEIKTKENEELADRFSRLKKQANEKLHAYKKQQTELQEEFEATKLKYNELKLKAEDSVDVAQLKVLQEQNADFQKKIEAYDEEQSVLKSNYQELEKKLNQRIQELTSNSDSQNNDKSLEKVTEELNMVKKELKDEKAANIGNFNSRDLPFSVRNENIDELKKQWEKAAEMEFQSKLERESKNLLELELKKMKDDFEQKAKNEAQTNNFTADNSRDEFVKKQHEEELETAKKKAFDTGMQQASMKTTLLEKKIMKLEARLQQKSDNTTKTLESAITAEPQTSKMDSDDTNEDSMAVRTGTTSEQSFEIQPAFSFGSEMKSNPFTSPASMFGNKSFGSTFGAKPTFSFGITSSTSSGNQNSIDKTSSAFSMPQILSNPDTSTVTKNEQFTEKNNEITSLKREKKSETSNENKKLKTNEAPLSKQDLP